MDLTYLYSNTQYYKNYKIIIIYTLISKFWCLIIKHKFKKKNKWLLKCASSKIIFLLKNDNEIKYLTPNFQIVFTLIIKYTLKNDKMKKYIMYLKLQSI